MSLYRSLHDNYDTLPARIRAVVDRAFNEASHEIRSAGLRTSTTDDAERLVDAIAAYIRRSNPERTVGWEFQATTEKAVEESGGVSESDRAAFERARQGAKRAPGAENWPKQSIAE